MNNKDSHSSALAAVLRRAAAHLLLFLAATSSASADEPALPRLRVSDNGRFLVTADGKPFFWLGDTAWHMFGKSVRDDSANQPSARLYFANRAAKGFTVIQSVIVRSPEGGSMANAYGFEPFENGNWSQPRLRPGVNDDYWDHIDWCLAEAKRQGLRMAALPCWLDSITDDNPMVRDPGVAYRYGHFLGTRYGQEPHLIWVLGGDAWQKGRNVDTPSRLALVRAMAEGIADGAGGVDRQDGQADWHNTLMTFHPPGGGHSSAEWLHSQPWLDFNMIQTTTRFAFQNWETVAKDYARRPPKPTFDAEVAYEGSLSLRKSEPQDRRIGPWDVRRAAYWDVFAGGCGHTYGHRSFIGWIRKGETYRFGAHIPWYESLDAPGAFQMGHLRRLMESLPDPLQRVPDQSLLASEAGTANEHIAVTRDAQGRYALVYSAAGRPFTVKLERLAGDALLAAWFDPREGTHRLLSEIARHGTREFTPPTRGEGQDWILVLNDASRNFQMPSLTAAERAARGPLWVHPENPRYFTDGSGKAIYLTGSHTWNNFQDNGVYPAVNYDEYLDFLQRHNHNFIRLWVWEQGGWDPWAKDHVPVGPLAYARTGPGEALDGQPKYDLTRFNDEYFARLRTRVQAAGDRGIYVSVMLFEGWSVEKKGQVGNPWQGHPFNKANNVNGIDGDLNADGQGPEIHTLNAPSAILDRQQAYVRRVIDTLNDLDNVLYEIGNEMHTGSVQWQYRMIEFIHAYQKQKPKQHPVGMTGAPIDNAALLASPADWIAPTSKDGYNTAPPAADGRKVILSDVDHVWPRNFSQWPWKSFTRGLNTAFMDLYGATKIGDKEIKAMTFVGDWLGNHETARQRMGHTLALARRVNLAAMTPQGALASTGYCLANATPQAAEYLVYLPDGGNVTVDLSKTPGTLAVEWIDPGQGGSTPAGEVEGGAVRSFQAPFGGDAVLYLRGRR